MVLGIVIIFLLVVLLALVVGETGLVKFKFTTFLTGVSSGTGSFLGTVAGTGKTSGAFEGC